MRYVYLLLVVAVTTVILVFTVQNIGSVTVWLFNASATLPLAVLVLAVYAMGMLTGTSLVAMLRAFWRGARGRRPRA